MPHVWQLVSSLFVCGLAVACGGSTSSNENGAGGTGSSTGGTNAGGAGGTAGTIGTGGGAGTSVGGTGGAPPNGVLVLDQNEGSIAGAIVVVDRADGSREENKTDTQGLAVFADIDFAHETVALTAFSPKRTLVSVLDVGPTASRVVHLHPAFDGNLFTRVLKLTITNKVSASDCVNVGATVPSVANGTCADSIDLPITPGMSGKIVAYEFPSSSAPTAQPPMKAGVVLDIPSTSDDVEIDFSKSELIEHASGSVPGMPLGPKQSLGSLGVSAISPSAQGPAAPSLASSSKNGTTFNWQADFFRAYPDAETRTGFSFIGNEGLQMFGSDVSVAGYFPGGAVPAFPAPPSLVEPSSGSASLFAPISWTAGSERPNHLKVAAVFDASNSAWPVWDIWFSPERDSLTLQKPPDSIWSQLDWSAATEVFPMLELCEPDPGACGSAPCTPSEVRWCARRAWALMASPYEL